MFCTKCGQQIPDTAAACPVCGEKVEVYAAPAQPVAPPPAPVPMAPPTSSEGMNFDFSSNTASAANMARFEYKVLSQKDKWFSGKFDPALLEQAMNAYAQQGWRVVGCATADIASFGGARQEFVTILEREVR